jgi:hypothetical protein
MDSGLFPMSVGADFLGGLCPRGRIFQRRYILTKKYIIDQDGEIIDEINGGDKIIRKKSTEYLKNTDVWNLESFFKGHIKEIVKLMSSLSTNEKAFLFSIIPYIGYNDCCLKFLNNKQINTEDFPRLTGLSRSVCYETINLLIKKDILYKGKNSHGRQYFINPWLFCKGQRINKVLKTMFENYRIKILGNVRWRDI